MYKLPKKPLALLIAVVMAFATSVAASVTVFAEEVTTITIFHTNDTHGRIIADDNAIGMDVVAAIAKSEPNSVLVDLGDTLHGLPIATLNKGADVVDIMNLAGYSLMVPGNHDFNYGYARLLELSELMEFELLSANVTLNGGAIFAPRTIKEIDGVKIGFFGLTTPETAYKTNPNNVIGIDWGVINEAAKTQAAALKEEGAQIIVCLAHVGLDASSADRTDLIAENVEGIDVIIDGHSHSRLSEGLISGNGTLIASTGEYGQNIGKVTLSFDKESGELVGKTAELISKEDSAAFEAQADVTAKINEIVEAQNAALSTVVGTAVKTLDGERATNRTSETNLGNLITDAMIAETEADIAITNGGGIRATIEEGDITLKDIVTVLPFGNYIVTKYLTGEQIIRVLEHGVTAYPETLGGFPQVSGLSFTFGAAGEVGNRVMEVLVNGEPIELDKQYLVATNDFLAVGGDGFDAYAESPTENEFGSLEEVTVRFITALGDVDYSKEDRIVALEGSPEENTATAPDTAPAELEPIDTDKNNPQTGAENNGLNIIYIVAGIACVSFVALKKKERAR